MEIFINASLMHHQIFLLFSYTIFVTIVVAGFLKIE